MIIKSAVVEKNQSLFQKTLTLFYGQNYGLKEEFKKKIKDSFLKSSIYYSSQEEILKNQNDFFLNLLNISLFNEQKVFIITHCNDKILDLLNEIENKIETQKVFLFSDQLDKRSKLRSLFEKSKKNYCVPCYDDDELSIKKIILEQLSGYKGLNSEIVNMLIDNSNFDRSKLNNELQKIKSLFIDKQINRNELEKVLNIKITDNFDIVKDAVLSGNKTKTNKLLSDAIIESEKIVYYLAIINQRLNKLFQAKLLAKKKTIEEIMRNFKPPIFWKDKPSFLNQFEKWNMHQLKSALRKTYNHEVTIKSNHIVNKEILFRKLLVDLCNLPNS